VAKNSFFGWVKQAFSGDDQINFLKLMLPTLMDKNTIGLEIGALKGEVIDIMLEIAPNIKPYVFEPIPSYTSYLKDNFSTVANLYPFALSNENGLSDFIFIKESPELSGLKERSYPNLKNPNLVHLFIEQRRLDDVIPLNTTIGFVHMNIDGAELEVLRGAENLLFKHHPKIFFTCKSVNLGFYNTNPSELFTFITKDLGYKLSHVKSAQEIQNNLNLDQFIDLTLKPDSYFLADAEK
jgi:FkbM family methyltransferase